MARRHLVISDRSDRDPTQADDRMADRVEHLSHLTLTPFMNRDLDDRLRTAWCDAHVTDGHARA